MLSRVRSLQHCRRLCTSSDEIFSESKGSTRILTLNRPKALNALNLNMVQQMYALLQQWECARDVELIIVKSASEKAFCAGGDVVAVTASAREAKAGKDTMLHKEFFREEYKLNHLIGTLTKPYVCLLNGIVMGGGCGISINGRFRVATEKTMLAMPETALGFFPDVGGSYFLSRLRNNMGMFLALTGYRLLGADTFHSGLATSYVDSTNLDNVIYELVALQKKKPHVIGKKLRALMPVKIPHYSLEAKIPQINRIFGAKSIEEIIKNLEADGSEFAQKQLHVLSNMSPTSLKVTHRQLLNGTQMPFYKIFTMEYRLSQHFLESHDFYEGCRASTPLRKGISASRPCTPFLERYFQEKFANYPGKVIERKSILLDTSNSKCAAPWIASYFISHL